MTRTALNLKYASTVCGSCDGTGIAYTMADEESIGQPYGSSGLLCPDCNPEEEELTEEAKSQDGRIILNPCGFVPRQGAPELCKWVLWTGMKPDKPVCCRERVDGGYRVCRLGV